MNVPVRFRLAVVVLGVGLVPCAPAAGPQRGPVAAEPDLETAAGWWPDLDNIWTPIGWPDHVFRFNVLFDGTLLVDPGRHRDRLGASGGVQLAFAPVTDDMRPGKQLSGLGPAVDEHRVRQSWGPSRTPVLRSEWVVEARVFHQEVFAHLPGGGPVRTGTEPLFAWVRLALGEAVPGLPAAARAGFAVKINAPFVTAAMSPGSNIRYAPERSRYPVSLTLDRGGAGGRDHRLVEPDGRVRLGGAAPPDAAVELRPGKPRDNDTTLVVLIDARAGRHVDLLVPLAPVDAATFDRELALGYDGALAQAERHWSERPATAATFDVPEREIGARI